MSVIQHANLLIAADEGKWLDVHAALKAGADPNVRTEKGTTALMFASRAGNVDVVKALIAAGADVNAQNSFGSTALLYACSENRADVVHELLAHGATVTQRDQDGDNALIVAIRINSATNLVRDIMNKGKRAEVQAKNKEGMTALHYAIIHHNVEVVRDLCGRFADVNAPCGRGFTPLQYAQGLAYFEDNTVGGALRGLGAALGINKGSANAEIVKVLQTNGAK
jgi:ankyrin repeat protein